MQLMTFLFTLLQAQNALSLLTSVPVGFGFTEEEEKRQEKCENFPIKLNHQGGHPFLHALSTQCRKSKRLDPTIRTTRDAGVSLAIVSLCLGVVTVGIKLWDTIVRQPEVDRKLELLQKALDKLDKLAQITIKDVERLANMFTMEQWKEITSILFESSDLEKIMGFFKLSPYYLLKSFGYDENMGLDVLKSFNYTFQCSEKSHSFNLEVCAYSNPSRVYGVIAHIAPIGQFIQPGVYRNYEIPSMALLRPDKTMISVEACQKMGSHFSCYTTTGNCTIDMPKQCPLKTTVTEDGVFVKDLGDATFIAADKSIDHYSISDNITNQHSYMNMDRSGQLLIRASAGQVVKIGTHSIAGRHNTFQVTPIIVEETVPMLSHDDIEEMKKLEKEANGVLEEAKYDKLHWDIFDATSQSSLWFLLSRFRTILIGCIVVLIVFLSLWFARSWGYCKKKDKKIDLNLIEMMNMASTKQKKEIICH